MSPQKKKQNTQQKILWGAFILAVSSAVVKVLSAVYRIPLVNIAGDEAMGFYGTAYQLYTVLLTIATAGLPIALSKMVATANALGRRNEPKRVFIVAVYTYGALSLVLSIFMFAFPDLFAGIMSNSGASAAIMAVAPAIFLVTIGSAVKGYFQGMQNMMPTSVANLIDALIKAIVGLALSAYLVYALNSEPSVIASGAIFGATAGALASLIFLVIVAGSKYFKKKKSNNMIDQHCLPSEPYSKLTVDFLKLSIPIMIGSLATTVAGLVDSFMIMWRLQSTGISEEVANSMYWGPYSSRALVLYNLPTFLILSITSSFIPAIAQQYAKRDTKKIKESIDLSSRITALIVFPSALGMSALSYPIINLLFKDAHLVSGPFSVLAIAIIFVSFAAIFSAILQAVGKQYLPVVYIFICVIIKTIISYILLGIPGVGLYGAAISTLVCYLLFFILNLRAIKIHTGVLPNVYKVFVRPLLSAAGCAASAYITCSLLWDVLGDKLSTVIGIGVGGIVYLVLIILTKAISKKDLKMLKRN